MQMKELGQISRIFISASPLYKSLSRTYFEETLNMSLCKPQSICRVTHNPSSSFSNKHSSLSLSHQGLHSYKCFSLRSSQSDDSSSGANQFPNAKHDSFKNVEDRKPFKVHEFGETVQNETPKEVVNDEAAVDEAYEEGSLLVIKNKIAEFVDDLNFKIMDIVNYLQFDSEDSYSIALYGSSAAAALYLATAVIGAIDSIPFFPKLMEVVGLGYSVWFTNRYLLFKKNRDELAAKIEELKQQVLGDE